MAYALPIAIGMQAIGGLLGAKGARDAGEAERVAAYKQAEQLRYNAGQVESAGQRDAMDEQRKADILQSRMLAVAGASGASALDPTVVNLAAGVEYEGKLASQTRRYNANVEAKGMRLQADATQAGGNAAAQAGKYRAMGTLLSTGGSIAGALK
jgi:hypothetical protein